MNGNEIIRANTCATCFHKQRVNGNMECHESTPQATPLITYVAVKDTDGYVMRWDPKIMGFVATWPVVNADQSCGKHSARNTHLKVV